MKLTSMKLSALRFHERFVVAEDSSQQVYEVDNYQNYADSSGLIDVKLLPDQYRVLLSNTLVLKLEVE